MASKKSVLEEAQKAAKAVKTESAARNAVQRVLAAHGYRKMPKLDQGRWDKGAVVRVYMWPGSPGGDVVLVAGPSIIHEVHDAKDLRPPAGSEPDFAVLMQPSKLDSSAASSLGRVTARSAPAGGAKKPSSASRSAAAKKAAATRKAKAKEAEAAAKKARAEKARQEREAKAAAEKAVAERKRQEAAEARKRSAAAKKAAATRKKKAREAKQAAQACDNAAADLTPAQKRAMLKELLA